MNSSSLENAEAGSAALEGKRVLVCGGRDFTEATWLHAVMNTLDQDAPVPLTLICGMAKGADSIAYAWAKRWDNPVLEFPAAWDIHGRSAGPIRNQKMLDEGKPDLVIAFPGGRGTADMVARAKAAGIEVWEPQLPSSAKSASPSNGMPESHSTPLESRT